MRLDTDSLAHTQWNCKYHIVFAPKYRRQVIYGKIKVDIGKMLVSFLDCDLARLKRFKEGLEFYADRLGEVVCYPWMTEFVRKYMEGTNITIKEIAFEEAEEYFFGS